MARGVTKSYTEDDRHITLIAVKKQCSEHKPDKVSG